MATVGIIGCGEAFDAGTGNNSCLLFGKGTPTVLFDCGYQIPERLWAIPGAEEDLDAICLTHFHADHAFGLAPLLVRMHENRRSKPLTLLGPQGVEGYVKKLVDLAYPGAYRRLKFKLHFRALSERSPLQWRGLKVECAASIHSIKNLALRVSLKGGGSFFVSGDGKFTEATLALARRSDLVLHETFCARREHPTHTCLLELHEALADCDAKTLVITHPARGEREAIESLVKGLAKEDPRWRMAQPGQTYPIRAK